MNSSVGEILREAREKQGRAIAEVAEELCLTQRYLRAIEADEVHSLPGSFFYRSFARQYAEYLGVDQTRVQAGLDTLLGPDVAMPAGEASAVDPAVESTNRQYFTNRTFGFSVGALFAVMLACTGFYAWWNQAMQTRTVAAAASVVRQASALWTPASDSTPALASSVQISQVASESNPSQVVLNLSATEETWLSITSGGKEIFSGILQPSQSKTVSGADIATMRIGNAGGVEIRLNGKALPPLGKRGDVLSVRFTPQDFKILPPNPEEL